MEKMPTLLPLPAASGDYSFALEYSGPPLPFEIPKAAPIEIEQIPVAAVATSAPPLDSLPVVQPILDSVPVVQPISPSKCHLQTLGLDDGDVLNSSSELNAADGSGGRASTDSSPLSTDFDDDDFESSPSLGEDDDVQRTAIVTFRYDSPPSSRGDEREEGLGPRVKKGNCFRCSKGNWFTEKEVCLVCDARYCIDCVLRAMGSMPEGRKCVGCIGMPVQDSKREKLGKSSRALKKLLSSLEIEQAMKAEKYCEANQLRAEEVFVNRKPLMVEEMVVLQSSPCPPPKLKPGYYWYDKVSGYWGKEGHKPDKIISANLNVGGTLMQNASNGNTGILVNGREITKAEMQLLKWAGVQCAGNPHFWVDADGSYREEGQKNVKGKIWAKPSMKLLCSFLSLPVPPKGGNPTIDEVNNIFNASFPNFFEQRMLQKVILLGYEGAGASTIFKQAKFLYESIPFMEDERQNIKLLIQSNIYRYLCILLEGRERFEEESLAEEKENSPCDGSGAGTIVDGCSNVTAYSLSPRLKAFSDWLLKIMASGDLGAIFPAATREYAPVVEELWKDPAIQATYSRRRELQSLPTAASYFLQRVVDISRAEYEPSDLDILYAQGTTSANGLASTEFSFPQAASEGGGGDDATQQESLVRYQLIRLPTKGLGENYKWLDMFEDARITVFSVALSDYDEYYEDANGVSINKMLESKRLFESIVNHHIFEQMDFLLILTKFDLLEQKIEKSPLTQCSWFPDFNPTPSRSRPNNYSNGRNPLADATVAQQAFHYVAVTFKRLFASLTGRKLYVTSVKGLEGESVDAALRYAREILKWEEERRSSTNEFTSYDASSTYT